VRPMARASYRAHSRKDGHGKSKCEISNHVPNTKERIISS
jgi:hypothetical protein